MSRKKVVKKKIIQVDPLYGDEKIAKFVNILMIDGKKNIAEKILYTSLDGVAKQLNIDCLEIFNQILDNVRPTVEVRSRRIGGATYQIPIDVSDKRSLSLAMRFLVHSARKKSGRSMSENLSEEFIEAYNNRGNAVKLKEERHKTAEANRAFSQFRW